MVPGGLSRIAVENAFSVPVYRSRVNGLLYNGNYNLILLFQEGAGVRMMSCFMEFGNRNIFLEISTITQLVIPLHIFTMTGQIFGS